MRLSEICIKRPVLTSMMSLGLVLFGIIGLSRLPVRELPDVDPPIINVDTTYPGASAHVVETQVTEPIEEMLTSIEGIRTLTSESREQRSSITVELNLSRDIDIAAQDVRDRVSRVRGVLPDDIDEPVVAKQDADASPVMWIALFGEQYSTLELTKFAEDFFKDRLQTVSGVSSVIIGGRKRFAIRLWLDSKKMAARGITVLDVQDALRRQSVELPSGRIENLERELSVETRGELKTPEEYDNLVLRQDGSTFVRLRDIGHAAIGVEDERSVARFNSQPSVGLGVVKQSKANTIEVVRGVKAELARLAPQVPDGVNIAVPYDESIFIEKSIKEVWETLGIAFLLVIGAIFIFLRNFRSTLVPSLTMPVSIIATFAFLYLMGYSINIISMLAFVLAIGVVVDDSIVVLENVFRHVEDGMTPMNAALSGMKEIGFAVIATTVALVAVFLPMAFQTTVTGRLLVEFAVAISIAVMVSSFVALTLTPAFAARVLVPYSSTAHNRLYNLFERGMQRLTAGYQTWLQRALRHRVLVVSVAAMAFVAGVWLMTQLESEFLPEEDKGRLFCLALTPEGSTSEYTDRMVRKMEEIVRSYPEVEGYFSAVALSRGGPGLATQGLMFIRLKDGPRRHIRDIVDGPTGMRARFFTEVEGAFAIATIPKAIGRGFGQPFQLVLQNPDIDELNRYAQIVVGRLQQEGVLMNVRTTFEINKPELRLSIDRNRAAALGVSIADISRTLQVLLGGLDLSKVKLAGKEYDVIAQLERASRLTPADLDRLYVRSAGGTLVQLSNVVTHTIGAGPNAIYRYNRIRSATIEGTPAGVPLGTVMKRAEQILKEELPHTFRYEWAAEARDLQEAGGSALFVFLLAGVIIYMVLAAQFESLVHPFTVMLTLPLAAIGAFGSLWLLNMVDQLGLMLNGMAFAPDASAFVKWAAGLFPRIPAMGINLFSQIGMILLMGLVTKNGILLVDFANQEMARGASARDAMLVSGRIRFRPILMTAASTVVGILPIAIGFGAGAESRRPLGVAAVGGMVASTLLTLFVIPVAYTVLDDLQQRARRWKAGRRASTVAAREPLR